MPRIALDDPALVAFMEARHLATLTTMRRDGTPHVAPVGVTYDAATHTARVITSEGSVKVRNVEAARAAGEAARVAFCHIDGAHWVTLEGAARVARGPEEIAESVRRYAARYRTPRDNPQRVAIVVDVDRVLGRLP